MSARALHVLAALLVPWAAAHPAHSAIRLASSGLRLRDGAAAHGATLSLRGGGAVPGVEWSQRQGSLMVKVEIPAGASFDDLHLAGDDDVIEWADDKVSLSLGLYGKLDKDSLAKKHCGRHVTLNAKKLDQAWWPKLTKGPKPGNVKVDWASWKDEDEGVLSARACCTAARNCAAERRVQLCPVIAHAHIMRLRGRALARTDLWQFGPNHLPAGPSEGPVCAFTRLYLPPPLHLPRK
jgi:hypothetical protein